MPINGRWHSRPLFFAKLTGQTGRPQVFVCGNERTGCLSRVRFHYVRGAFLHKFACLWHNHDLDFHDKRANDVVVTHGTTEIIRLALAGLDPGEI
jgi:hypothetical protein